MARHARPGQGTADPWAEEPAAGEGDARRTGSRRQPRARRDGAEPRAEEGSWLDDAFDERKAAADWEKAKGSPVLGCGLALAVAAALGLIAFAFAGILGALGV